VLSLLGAFITPFFWFSSGEIIPILYGKQWLPAIPCLQWMALAMWAQMILSSAGTIFQSLGDTRRLLWSGSMNAVLVVAFIIAGLVEGSIVAVARNVAIAYNLQFVATFYILVHLSFGFRTRDFLKGLLPDLCVMAAVALSGYGCSFLPALPLVGAFAVKAGITGLAQVAGNYDTTPQDKLRYDLLYIKNYSVLQDIKIMFLTVRAIFTPNLYNRTFEDNKTAFRSSDAHSTAQEQKNV
jgi:PST family polysaccharide transporter